MAIGNQMALVIRGLFVKRLVTNLNVASAAMFIWDYLLTFSMEVDLVWKSRWNLTKGLYLVQRYLPFIDTVVLILYRQNGKGLTRIGCRNITFAAGVIMLIGLSVSEMILTLRTWAVWNRDRRLTIILPILYFLCWGSSFIVRTIYLTHIKFNDPVYPEIKGCFQKVVTRGMAFLWMQLIAWNALLLVLMVIPAVRAYRCGGSTALTRGVYRDGVIYYLYLFVLSSINVIIIETLPDQYQHLLASVTRVLHSILTSRALLHIRFQAGGDPVRSDGLTDLNTDHIRGDGEIKFVTTKRSSVA